MTGRQTARTPEAADRLCRALEMGHTHKAACALAGISPATFYDWKGSDLEFLETVGRAEATAIEYHVAKINADPSWRSSAWMLERRFPEHYARHEHLDLTSKGEHVDTIRVIIERPE